MAVIISNQTSASVRIDLFKKYQENLLGVGSFISQERPEDDFMATIFRTWHIGSYTMAAKPINTLELQYTMIQFFSYNCE